MYYKNSVLIIIIDSLIWFVAAELRVSCTPLFLLCGLVPACGSAVVRRSGRSLRNFGASLPVTWSHPTFIRYKAFTRCWQ
jgi:hypothetical protein